MGQGLPTCCCSEAEDTSANAVTVVDEERGEQGFTAQYQVAVPKVVGSNATLDSILAAPGPTGHYGSIVCEFVFNGEVKIAVFNRKPLGISFGNRLPLTITRVSPGSEAEAQGVQNGWSFTKVGGTALAGMDLEKVIQLIQQKSSNLAPAPASDKPPGASVTFEFVLPDGQLKSVTFYKRPLGMTFANKLPLSVIKLDAGGEAEKNGVECGWLFSKVGGVPVNGMTLEKIVTLILENSVHLPLER